MEPEWLKQATGFGMWFIGFLTAGNALLLSFVIYRKAYRYGRKLGMKEQSMKDSVKASYITALGPCLGIFVGMTVLVIALGGAVAFIRESAGVGSIMFELIAARAGSEAAGVQLTREGMSATGLSTVLWAMATGSVAWVLIGGVFTRWLPKLKDLMGQGNPKQMAVISAAIMLAAFGRLFISDGIVPLIRKGAVAPFTGAIVALVVAIGWLLWADKLRKPAMKEYFLLIAIIVGMAAAQMMR
ncbi:MAG: hypothetical protein AMJ94_15365 [Deltaproteobacteria bacterium SM23_61]|nr:MAG: hypothetical protein AMJ94_15365 [Deltaproteobacteria bacterium SM23_61]